MRVQRDLLVMEQPVLISLLFLISFVCGVALQAQDTEVEVGIHLTAGVELAEPVRVQLTLTESAGEAARREVLEVLLPGEAHLTLPAQSTWHVAAQAESLWIKSRVVRLGADAQTIRLRALPGGWIEGRVELRPAEAAPDALRVRTLPSRASDRKLPETQVDCPVVGRRFRCFVVAGTLDLKLHAGGYIPHYRWEVEVPWNGRLDLGTLELGAGASVAGQVEPPDPTFEFTRSSVELEPVDTGLEEVTTRRDPGMSIRTALNERGFFQIRDLPAGAYTLRLHHPRYAGRIESLTVAEGTEVVVKSMELLPVATLVVRVEPPVDPFHQAWRIKLLRDSSQQDPADAVDEGRASRQGVWQARGLEWGEYRLSLEDSNGEGWLWETLYIEAEHSLFEAQVR